MPGATVAEPGDLLVADSGLDDDTFNIVAAARFSMDEAPARIAETVATLAATGRSFSWWVGPASTPPDLTDRLIAAGLPASERETAMLAELDDTLPPPAVPGLEIRTVTTSAQLADYATVLAANWNPPAATVRDFFARAASQALAATCPARYLVGYLEDRPVCSAEVFSHAGVAGIYNKPRPTANLYIAASDSAPAASSSNMPSTAGLPRFHGRQVGGLVGWVFGLSGLRVVVVRAAATTRCGAGRGEDCGFPERVGVGLFGGDNGVWGRAGRGLRLSGVGWARVLGAGCFWACRCPGV